MSAHEHAAWDAFLRYIATARPALDGSVPVAMICLPAKPIDGGEPSEVTVDLDGQGRIIWPSDFPIAARGPLLARLAEPYRNGRVRR